MTDIAILTYGFSFFMGLLCMLLGDLDCENVKTSIGKFFAKLSYIIGVIMILTLAIKLFFALVML